MKNRKTENVLAIDPGTRHFGFAIFEGKSLQFYGVKTINRRTKSEKLRKLRTEISKFIDRFAITRIAIERPIYTQQKSSMAKRSVERIRSLVNDQYSDIVSYQSFDPQEVRRAICGSLASTKENTAKQLARLHPELKPFVKLPTRDQVRYYSMQFGAIAVGLYASENQGKQTTQHR